MGNASAIKERPAEELEALCQGVAELENLEFEHDLEKEVLKESEEKLRRLVERTHDIIFQLSPLGTIQYVSPRVEELYGYQPEDLVGKHLKKTTPKSELPRALKALKIVLHGNTISNFEINQLDAYGQTVLMEINGTPVRKNGKIITAIGIMRDITKHRQAEEEAKGSMEKPENGIEKTVQALVMLSEMKDPYTAGHQQRVTQLACAIAKVMDLSEDRINVLRLAGLFHDIGKLCIPAEILTNRDGLSEAEVNILKMHPLFGHDILKTVDLPWPVAQIVYRHHERIDGSGYPSGLSGKDIFLEARILAVADVVEAMASPRPYRAALGEDEALDEISQKRGTLYDPDVADACLTVFKEKEFRFN